MGVNQVHAALVVAGCHSIVTRGNHRGSYIRGAMRLSFPGPAKAQRRDLPASIQRDQSPGDRELIISTGLNALRPISSAGS
jgi:hypothetical protein